MSLLKLNGKFLNRQAQGISIYVEMERAVWVTDYTWLMVSE